MQLSGDSTAFTGFVLASLRVFQTQSGQFARIPKTRLTRRNPCKKITGGATSCGRVLTFASNSSISSPIDQSSKVGDDTLTELFRAQVVGCFFVNAITTVNHATFNVHDVFVRRAVEMHARAVLG